MSNPQTTTINGKVFHVPADEVYCKKCKTTNYFYEDDLQPFKCDTCGADLTALLKKNRLINSLPKPFTEPKAWE